jgi:hypothetical protein
MWEESSLLALRLVGLNVAIGALVGILEGLFNLKSGGMSLTV